MTVVFIYGNMELMNKHKKTTFITPIWKSNVIKIMAIKLGITQQQLIHRAVNDFFLKYSKELQQIKSEHLDDDARSAMESELNSLMVQND